MHAFLNACTLNPKRKKSESLREYNQADVWGDTQGVICTLKANMLFKKSHYWIS